MPPREASSSLPGIALASKYHKRAAFNAPDKEGEKKEGEKRKERGKFKTFRHREAEIKAKSKLSNAIFLTKRGRKRKGKRERKEEKKKGERRSRHAQIHKKFPDPYPPLGGLPQTPPRRGIPATPYFWGTCGPRYRRAWAERPLGSAPPPGSAEPAPTHSAEGAKKQAGQ
jgi:hypothetical protein